MNDVIALNALNEQVDTIPHSLIQGMETHGDGRGRMGTVGDGCGQKGTEGDVVWMYAKGVRKY